MKLYLFKASKTDWDEYDAVLIIAENKETAKEISDSYFNDSQKPIRCSYEGISSRKTKRVLITSFIAG